MPKKERPSQENSPENSTSPEAEKVLEDELSAAQEDIEAERSWRRQADATPELSQSQEAKKSIEYVKPQGVAEMIESGVSDKDIWETAKDAGRFYKFDGSSYYLSEALSDPDSGAYWWKRESAAGNKGGDGHRQDDMFRDKIEQSLQDYRDLIDSFDSVDDLFAAIDNLKQRDEPVKKEKLLEMSSSERRSPEPADAAKEKVEQETEKTTEDEAPEDIPEEGLAEAESESESDNGITRKERPDEDGESAEGEPEISVDDPVHRKINGARRWSEPREVDSIMTDNEGQRYIKTKGGDDASYHPAEEFELAGNKEISAEVAEEFDSQFSISVEDLSTISGFEELSEGQQQLVLENFRKLTLSRIDEEGVKDYREELSNAETFSRMWKGFLSSYYKASAKAEAGERLLSGGIETHREALADIVEKTKQSGLDMDESGRLKFADEDQFEDLSVEDIEVITSFNNAAQEFADVSSDWRYADVITENISGSNREAYKKAQTQYRTALQDYLDLVREKQGAEGVQKVMDIDKKIRFSQFFASDKDYESAVQNIKDEPKWRRVFDNVAAEKGAYMGMGWASRSAAFGTLGAAAGSFTAVFAAAGLGAYRGRSKAIESLEDEALVRRSGGEATISRNAGDGLDTMGESENKAEVINAVSSDKLTEKLRNLLNTLDGPGIDDEAHEQTAQMLTRRVEYTKRKIEDGLVDYGEAERRTGKQYDLLQTLSEAQALDVINNDPDVEDDIADRLDRYLDYKDDKTRQYVKEKTVRGALLGASFAGLGAALRELSDVFADGSELEAGSEGGGDASAGADSDGGGSSPDAEIIGGNEGGGETVVDSTGAEGGGESITADSAGGEEIPTPEIGSQQITIDEAGEGMIHAIADKLSDDYGIAHDKAMEIGNELFLKGEQLEGDDEMFNLVGKGATFSIDFGELTPADLQEQSADDLTDTIDFDQEAFNPGESGIKGEELPANDEAEMESVDSAESQNESTLEEAEVNKANTFLNPDGPQQNFGISQEEFQSWKEEMKSQGVVIDEGGGEPAADQAVETQSASATEAREVPVESESAAVESGSQPDVDAVPVSHLRGKVAYVDALLETDTDLVAAIPEDRLNVLSNLLERYDDMTLSESITQIGEDDPRLLTVLERTLTADNIHGEPLSDNDQQVLDFVRQQVNQLSAADFENGIPPYAQESLAASESSVSQ